MTRTGRTDAACTLAVAALALGAAFPAGAVAQGAVAQGAVVQAAVVQGLAASGTGAPAVSAGPLVLVPDRVLDGTGGPARTGLAVLVDSGRIIAVAPRAALPVRAGARELVLPGTTLLPGLIDLHSHVLLHPYDEVPWETQVLREGLGERVARATVHLARTLAAGFTTLRDLGTEGAGSADVGLREALAKGVVPGPRLVVAERAIVMRGSYAPRGFAPEISVPVAAEEVGNLPELVAAVRGQIGRGADVVKVYADYRWGPNGSAEPAFTVDELRAAVEIAASSGRPVVAHASTAEGMRRAALAGVQTIEHGDGGTPEVFRLMRERGVVFVPTVAAGHAIAQYGGWRPGRDPEPVRVRAKRASIRAALDAGVTIANGSDVGVFAHGDNARELELLVDYGLSPSQAIAAATTVAGRVLDARGLLGTLQAGAPADLLVVRGDPATDIRVLRDVHVVVQRGVLVRTP